MTDSHDDPAVSDVTRHWAVTVERNGETVVTIGSNLSGTTDCLSGRDLSAEDEQTIRLCAEHLRAFIGAASFTPGGATDFGTLLGYVTTFLTPEELAEFDEALARFQREHRAAVPPTAPEKIR